MWYFNTMDDPETGPGVEDRVLEDGNWIWWLIIAAVCVVIIAVGGVAIIRWRRA